MRFRIFRITRCRVLHLACQHVGRIGERKFLRVGQGQVIGRYMLSKTSGIILILWTLSSEGRYTLGTGRGSD